MMDKEKLVTLAQKYLDGTATKLEQEELHQWYDAWDDGEEQVLAGAQTEESIRGAILDRIQQQMHLEAKQARIIPLSSRKWFRVSAVASVILIGITTAWLLFFPGQFWQNAENTAHALRYKNDIPPGREGAILTLADGRQIMLDSATNGIVANQSNADVIKKDGQLIYNNGADANVVYNTMATPRGRQYRLVLADGSRVWLNASSSITFPTAFTGNERKVAITGEVYFEVNPSIAPGMNRKRPFKVTVNGMEITVLGTHFNVNAHADETAIHTTLLEGSVLVTRNGKEIMLKPGQQASATDELQVTNNIDVEEIIAWKNGRFSFNNADLESIMRQMARWYDVEVVFEDKIPDRYTVDVPKNVPVSSLLQFIELSGGVHFSIDQGKITVKK